MYNYHESVYLAGLTTIHDKGWIKMKYIVVLTDGAADYKIDALGGKTVYEKADIPNMDEFARNGKLYMVKTVPDGYKPGSDVANLSVMGFSPKGCYTGRSPLEAASVGVKLTDSDMCFRANLVTLSGEEKYEDKTMVDYSAGEISTDEAAELISYIDENLKTDKIRFFAGTSYRHIMRWETEERSFTLTPPHDISDKVIGDYLPDNSVILDIMKKSEKLLINHPVNKKRIAAGKNPATSLWIWGEGTRPALSRFHDTYGKKGAVISAVDLIKGIAACADMAVYPVDGITGTVHTNYDGKAKAAIKALSDGNDLIYIHLEGPDECGHQGDLEGKVRAVSLIDEKIIAPIRKAMEEAGEDYRFLIMPDHPTPVSIKTHVSDPVPAVIYESGKNYNSGAEGFSEAEALTHGEFVEEGFNIMAKLLSL